MTLPLLPLLLLGPLFLLAAAVVDLAAHGPLGWLAAALLLVTVALAVRAVWRRCSRWWASTKAPVREPTRPGPRAH